MYKEHLGDWGVRKYTKRRPSRTQIGKKNSAHSTFERWSQSQTKKCAWNVHMETSEDPRRGPGIKPLHHWRKDLVMESTKPNDPGEDAMEMTHSSSKLTFDTDILEKEAGTTKCKSFLRPEYITRSNMTNGHDYYERSLLLMKAYIAGNFESSVWQFSADDMLSIKSIQDVSNGSLEIFMGHLRAGYLLLSKEETRFAELELINASACMKDLMLSNDPRTIDTLLGIVSRIEAFKVELRPLLQQFAAMAGIVLGKFHPLTCISQIFNSGKVPCRDIIAPMSEAIIARMSHWLGPLHLHSLIYRKRCIMIFGKSPLGYSITESPAPNINCPTDIYSHQSFKTQVELGWLRYGQKAYIEAQHYALGILERSKLCVDEGVGMQLKQEAHELLAHSQRALGEVSAAERNYIQCLSLIKFNNGEFSGHLVGALSDLEDWYKEWIMLEKSMSIKTERERLQLAMTEIL